MMQNQRMCRSSRHGLRRGEQGASLVVVMMVLLVVSVIGVAGARLALLGEMSARHDRDSQIAFEAAEAALVDAQDDIEGNPAAGSCAGLRQTDVFKSPMDDIGNGVCKNTTATKGLCTPAAEGDARPTWAKVDFLDDSANAVTVPAGTFTCRAFDAGSAGVKPARPPRYIIEYLKDTTGGTQASTNAATSRPEAQPTFRITAMGFGPRLDTRAVVQIEYRRSK
jgi:type IV pilus assembly protein PilX